jgi:hypothetical protein
MGRQSLAEATESRSRYNSPNKPPTTPEMIPPLVGQDIGLQIDPSSPSYSAGITLQTGSGTFS